MKEILRNAFLRALAEKNLSVYALSRKTGISEPTIAHIKQGKNFNIETLETIFDYLKIKIKIDE